MGDRLDRFANGLLRPINPYASVILGLLTASWGIWLLMPWETFGTAKLYSKMDEFAPEWAWGTWALICGALIIFAVAKGLYKTLSFAIGFAVWHWATVSSMMWWGDWQNTGGLTYSFITLYCIYAYLNIKINYVQFGEDIPDFHLR